MRNFKAQRADALRNAIVAGVLCAAGAALPAEADPVDPRSIFLSSLSFAEIDFSAPAGANSQTYGRMSVAPANNSLAVGYSSAALGNNSLVAGPFSRADGANGVALGAQSLAYGENSTAVGVQGAAAGPSSSAFGVQSLAAGANSTAVGVQSLALGDNSVALGVMSEATGVNSTALGNLSRASGSNSTAVGIQSMAAGDNTLAIGNVSFATESNSVAIGTGSRATRSDAIAVGNQAAAGGPGAIAIGAGASANAPNSVAIGSGSVAIAPNTVSVGSPDLQRRITNVAPGLAATDAVNVQQWQVGLSATTKQTDQISNKVDVMNSRLTSMAADVDGRIDAVNREARRGIAAAVALAAAPMPSAPGRTTVAVNAGYYHGEAGFGVGISHRFNATVPLVLSGSYANGGGNEHVGRVGMALEF